MPSSTLIVLGLVLSLLAPLARAEIVVIVNAQSPVSRLEKNQVSDLFLGKVATFPDGSQAVPLDQDNNSGLHSEFHDKVTGKSLSQLRAYWSRLVFTGKATPPREIPDSGQLRTLIATNPNMIGYIDKGAVDTRVKVVYSP
ncbi:phosphate ABC transporter substrate-binding protein [Candidatus Woesearchaeota archaeon]|jgi:ABC-type phosphate transport system substrate-binding protein|nr:phosphate ABC transporter substrate-binding protein [Candidatus Woesearchaeota archaeon]